MIASFVPAKDCATTRALAGLVVGIVLGPADLASAGDWAGSEMQSRRDWFQSLMEPGTNSSCCDEADCRRTVAQWRQGGWWAVVRGEWRPIPEASVLKGPRSIDGEAYVCSGDPALDASYGDTPKEPRIYCFVPPDLGS